MTTIDPLMALAPRATSSIPGYTTTLAAAAPTNSAASNPLASLAGNAQTFLQLLVAQLQYQNPLNPVSGTAFLSQTAQMMQSSQMAEMTQIIKGEAASSQIGSATSLIGKKVTGSNATGSAVTGVVSSVSIDPNNGPTLNVTTSAGSDTIALSSVTQVST